MIDKPTNTAPTGRADTEGEVPNDINRGMAKGAAWMIAMRLSIRFLGIISTIILARILVPEDFGLIALATMI